MDLPDFVLCIDNADYPISLLKGLSYRVIGASLADNLLCVVDETGSYGWYPKRLFKPT